MKTLCLILGVLLSGLFLSACTPSVEESHQESVVSDITAGELDRYRFLDRATFGATDKLRNEIKSRNLSDWLEEQKQIAATEHYPILHARLTNLGYVNIEKNYINEKIQERRDLWWEIAVTSEDQLRQRMAFALSQIFVVSDKNTTLAIRSRGLAHYYDIFVRHAFGNFRDILSEVTLHPSMGDYLSHRKNEKADSARNVRPDENYARELMQLFTIGLWELNSDGSYQLDSEGGKVPTYTQAIVEEYAKVFTGINYGDSSDPRSDSVTINSEAMPMTTYDSVHDQTEKYLLNGVVLASGQTASEDIEAALDSLFEHDNVAPFISKQLIQRFVTSNPSTDYVERVAQVFNNNGSGIKGDLSAVINAILLDEEAIDGYNQSASTFGKIKEPVIKITKVWREFNAQGVAGKYRMSIAGELYSQQAQSAPSVFNFYRPHHTPGGVLSDAGKLSPESQILDESTISNLSNTLQGYAYSATLGSEVTDGLHTMVLDLSGLQSVSSDVSTLIETLNIRLLNGRMSDELKAGLASYIGFIPLSDGGLLRSQEATAMVLMSPDFAIQQ